jgi:hypothetical protein
MTGCTSYNACKVKMTVEGVYYFTATGKGSDGNTCSDTAIVTVLNRNKIDALLKGKWEGMKMALSSGNIEEAVSYFTEGSQASFRQSFTALAQYLPQIIAGMGEFKLFNVIEHVAECDLRTVKNGVEYSFQVLFVRDYKGNWGIHSF